MNTQQKIIKLLQRELVLSQSKNQAYSLRSFSRRLKCSPSVVSEILNGRRPISKRNGEKFLNAINISPDIVKKLTADLPNRSSGAISNAKSYVELDVKHFNLVANWYYFGILSLVETKNVESDPSWIAERFGINLNEAKKAINTLISLELLKFTKNNKLKATGKHFTTTTDISEVSIRKNHLQHLEMAKLSLEQDDVKIRDFASLTFTLDPKKIDLAKKMLKDFRREFCSKMEKTNKIEVYRLGMQLIPLSRRKTK